MIINHNMSAAYANRMLKVRDNELSSNIEKLSSGQKINKGADDASGLAVSEKLRAQVKGLNTASKNISNAVSLIQTTEGYLQESQDILHRIRELSVQSANGIYTQDDRMQIQVEVSQLVDEVNRIASHAQFNGMDLLKGDFTRNTTESVPTASMWFQVGANMDQREQVFIQTMTAQALGVQDGQGSPLDLQTPDGANRAIAVLDDALSTVSKQRADLGAYQNRFEMAVKGVDVAAENMTAAESLVRDTNMAEEMVGFVKNQILAQAGQSMLTQANMRPQGVVQLLG